MENMDGFGVIHSNILSLYPLIVLDNLSLLITSLDDLFKELRALRLPSGLGGYGMEFYECIFTIIALQRNKHQL
jgi:hypothetical protein